jgi:hypothetical protein
MNQPSASAAKQYLEDYVLTKWEVRDSCVEGGDGD